VADNDFAVGKLIQDIANSPTLKTNTLVFVIEDDAQNGGDHVDAHRSVADVFDTSLNPNNWSFTAAAAPILYTTELNNENPPILPSQAAHLIIPRPAHGGEYWARVTKGMNFSQADRVDPVLYNRILWRGLKGDVIYPGDSSLAETRRRYKEALKRRTTDVTDSDQ
jgi:hypothetical protein